MKIGIILNHNFDPNAGGVQRVSNSISEIFSNFKYETIIICFTKQIHLSSDNKVPVFSVSNEKQLRNLLKDENITLIINQEGYSFKFTKLLLRSRPAGSSIINNLHINPLNFVDNYKEFVRGFFIRYKLEFLNNQISQKVILFYHIAKQRIELNFIIKNTDAFVMLSERFKPELFTLAPNLRKYENKIHGVGNPFERPKIKIEELKKENIVLFVGRINILQKRVDLLVEIWKQLHASCPEWQFWVLGEGEDRKFMEDFCKKNKLDRVKFFGKDNPNSYYTKAKIFHMTSAFEGFGNVLVEAQSYGCVPILFNSYSAAQDIINHDVDGFLINPFNVDAYVKQTIELMNNPDKLEAMSKSAFENVCRFSYEKTYQKWEAVFKATQ